MGGHWEGEHTVTVVGRAFRMALALLFTDTPFYQYKLFEVQVMFPTVKTSLGSKRMRAVMCLIDSTGFSSFHR